MQQIDDVGTCIWLEKTETTTDRSNKNDLLTYQFSFDSTYQKYLSTLLKKKYTYDGIIHTAWATLLHRLCTVDALNYGTATAKEYYLIPSHINGNTTIHQHLKHLTDQIKHITKSKPQHIGEMHYCCLTNAKYLKQLEDKFYDIKIALIYDTKKRAEFTFIFQPSLYSKQAIKRIASYFEEIIKSFSENTEQALSTINMMNDAELKKIKAWSSPSYKFKTLALTKSTRELIEDFAGHHPDKLAIKHGHDTLSFSELNNSANQLATYLMQQGVKPNDNIAVLMDRTPALIIAVLALHKIKAVFVPINTRYPLERTEFVINDSDAKIILAHEDVNIPEKFKSKYLHLSRNWRDNCNDIKPTPLPHTDKNDTAYIIYTSGTTGTPKGVMVSHGNLTNLTEWYLRCYEMGPDDRQSQFASQAFDTFICETLPVLSCGASVHIVEDNIKLAPTSFFAWLAEEKITLCDLPTAFALMLFTLEWPTDLSIRMMKIGGESCTRYPDKPYAFDIWNVYGPTETTIEATYYLMHRANQQPKPALSKQTPSIGAISEHGETYVVDQYMQLVPQGIAGELLIGGACVAQGYYHRDELTKKKFIKNKFNPTSDKPLYRTGDLVAWLPDGTLMFVGRIDNQVKVRGYRVELGDIENALGKYPDVCEVAVIAKDMPNGDKSIIAYIVPNLDRERFLFQERCLMTTEDNKIIEGVTEDISKSGIAITGIGEEIKVGTSVKIHVKLPGFNESKNLYARLIWQQNNRAGFAFDLNPAEQETVNKSIDHFIASSNVMELLISSYAKRSLRKALTKKVPEYMVPTTFVTLTEFPLTFSGKVDMKALPPPDDFNNMLSKQSLPPKTPTEIKLAEIWKFILKRDNISMDENFFDVGGNSIRAAELSVKIMQEFNITIPAQILFDLPYITIQAQYIDTNGELYTTQSFIQDEIERDLILPENIQPCGLITNHHSKPKNILLTGAGGFLGVFMLSELMQHTDAKIFCLVRSGEFESPAVRLANTIDKFGLAERVSLSDRRIVVISSDLNFDKFGLSDNHYESLASKIDIIYHCGAQVNIMASYNKLRGSNVKGTLEIIKFATHRVDKPIHYVSTLSSAYLTNKEGALTEEFPSDHFKNLFGGYAISKWVSERLLTLIKHRGLPVSLYRSGYISGDTTSGITSLNDALLMLIKGCIQLGYAPIMQEKITILPVDFVSRAILNISLLTGKNSEVYHIDHPTGIMWVDLVAWLTQYGYQIELIPMHEWKIKLRSIDNNNALYSFLPYYLAIADDYHSADVVTDKASLALQQCNLSYPAIDDKMLSIYFRFLIKEGFLPAPVTLGAPQQL